MMKFVPLMLAACFAPLEAPQADAASTTFKVAIQAPTPCDRVSIEEVLQRNDEIIVVARVQARPVGMVCAAMIATSSAEVTLPLEPPAILHRVILGKKWGWEIPGEDQGYQYFEGRNALFDAFVQDARPVSSAAPEQ